MSKLRRIKYLIKSKFCDHEWEEVEEIKFGDAEDECRAEPNKICTKCGMWWDEYEGKNR